MTRRNQQIECILSETARPMLSEWIRDGSVVLPSRRKAPPSVSMVRQPAGTVQKLLQIDQEY